jgi:hypothetical protein
LARSEHPPAAPEAEELAELSDDVIIAQESRAHSPRPRVHVDLDPRTVVIAEDAEHQTLAGRAAEPEPMRELPPFAHAAEKTLVVRDRRTVGSSRPPAGYSSAPPHRDQRVLIVLMCLVAALLAFSLGGALAMLLSRRSEPPASAGPPASGVSDR